MTTVTKLSDAIVSLVERIEGPVTLAHIATRLDATETWGAELSPQRAQAASLVLAKVHACAWQSCRAGRGSVSLILCNPTYDDDPLTHTRLEQQFLDDALPVLSAGGVLIYIILHHLAVK